MDSNYILGPHGELYHWGIKGQKWGIRRYQNKDGSLTPAGQKRYDDKLAKIEAKTAKIKEKQRIKQEAAERKSKLKAAKQALADAKNGKKQAAAEEAARKAAEDDNARRERILKEPTAKEVLENRHLFNDREIQSLRLRLQEENTIKSLVPAEVSKGKQFVDKTVETLNQVSSVVESGSKAWNGVAKVYNSLWGKRNGLEVPMINEKAKSKADKLKEEAELLEAKNRLKKAQDEGKEKEKSDYDKLKEEVERMEMENRRKKAENNRYDAELDKRGLDKRAKDMDDAEAKAEAKRKKEADEEARKENEARSQREYDAANPIQRKTSGERTVIDPNRNRSLTIYNPGTQSLGKSYVDRTTSTNAISPNVANRIQSMTARGDKSYAEIANALGVSTSTVQNYSRGRDTAERYMSYDEDGNFVGYWSAIKAGDGNVIEHCHT